HEYILRNWRIVKIATTKAQRKLFFNLRSMKSGLNTLTPDEVEAMASQLRVKPEEVVEMEMRLGGQDVALEPSSDDDDDTFSPISYLTHAEDEPGRILEHEQNERLRTDGLAKALEALDPRSRRIIETRWLREQDTATLHELADEFGVSAERIRQIESQAMKKMKKAMAAAA
ncbi:MAG: sigma-70 family RNA polymerase sigma factor, partial [Burkholderiales bacterium]|nr:sigma-70 family RNA polymerase sigma factor [Burkholderiales bacterium]